MATRTRKMKPKTDAPAENPTGNAEKDPATWATGGEPMTGAQKSYLGTLSDEAGVETDDALTKAQASQQIETLRDKKHVIEHRTDDSPNASNTQKDPHDWATGGEPMTGAQKSYLKTLSDEAGEAFDETLTKGEASLRIEALKNANPRTK